MNPLQSQLQQYINPLYQTKDSLAEATQYINMRVLLDIPSSQVQTALAIYQNTLIAQIVKEISNDETNCY